MTPSQPLMDQMLLVDLAQVKTLTQALTAFQVVGMAAKDFSSRTRTEYTHDLAELITFLSKHGITTLDAVTLPYLEAYQAELDRRGLAVSSRHRTMLALIPYIITAWIVLIGYSDPVESRK